MATGAAVEPVVASFSHKDVITAVAVEAVVAVATHEDVSTVTADKSVVPHHAHEAVVAIAAVEVVVHQAADEGVVTPRTGNIIIVRAAVELAKEWRLDKALRRLEALLLTADREKTLIISGTGDVIEPDEDVAAIGSGGAYALAAARALLENSELDPRTIAEKSMSIAADICIYTNHQLTIEELA